MSITYDNYLEHYGVKGMKWGVRKDSAKTSPVQKISDYKTEVKGRYNKDRTRELRKVEVTSKNGEKVVATEDRSPKFASFISSLSNKGYQDTLDNPSFSITVDGEKVGESSFYNKRDGEIHLVWLGINPQHRGKGYASSVFDAAVEYGKSEGADKLTLEVPGFSPDARHIYERRGFKVTKEPTEKDKKKDIIWGGLTHMQLDLTEKSLAHTDRDDLELERAFELTFAKLPNDVEKEVFGKVSDVEHGILTYDNYLKHHGDKTTEVNMSLTYDNYLEHYGVKGMKWGSSLRKSVEEGLNNAADSARDTASDAKAAASEMKAAFQGGDDGYGGLLEIVGSEEKAIELLNMIDKAGQTHRTAKTSMKELKEAYKGGDWGYGATADIMKSEKHANTAVNTAASIGERVRKSKSVLGLK